MLIRQKGHAYHTWGALSVHEAVNQPTVISRLVIDRYHSNNVDWEVGGIIREETQLCPQALQSLEEGDLGCWLMSAGAAGSSSTTRTALAWLDHEQPCMKRSA